MISNIYTLWKVYCIIRAIHGVFITMCFFRWILGKSYYPIITIFSYFYEKKAAKRIFDDLGKDVKFIVMPHVENTLSAEG